MVATNCAWHCRFLRHHIVPFAHDLQPDDQSADLAGCQWSVGRAFQETAAAKRNWGLPSKKNVFSHVTYNIPDTHWHFTGTQQIGVCASKKTNYGGHTFPTTLIATLLRTWHCIGWPMRMCCIKRVKCKLEIWISFSCTPKIPVYSHRYCEQTVICACCAYLHHAEDSFWCRPDLDLQNRASHEHTHGWARQSYHQMFL